jgi:hypothetical protein
VLTYLAEFRLVLNSISKVKQVLRIFQELFPVGLSSGVESALLLNTEKIKGRGPPYSHSLSDNFY